MNTMLNLFGVISGIFLLYFAICYGDVLFHNLDPEATIHSWNFFTAFVEK